MALRGDSLRDGSGNHAATVPTVPTIAIRGIHRGDRLIAYGCYETQQALVFKDIPGRLPRGGMTRGTASVQYPYISCLDPLFLEFGESADADKL